MKIALIIVDAQQDFAEERSSEIDSLIDLAEGADLVIATRSVHPRSHFSFAEFGPHCIHGTKGARLHPRLEEYADYVTTKVGLQEHYSGFESGTLRPKESLEEILRAEEVTKVWIGGFGHGWDVPQTAFDANALGYDTIVFLSASNEVDPETIEKLNRAGVNVED